MNNTRRYTINHIPFLRLLIPLIVGITCQHIYPTTYMVYLWICIAVGCGVATWIKRKNPLSHIYKYYFTLCISSLLVVVGMILYQYHTPRQSLPETTPQTIAIARIDNSPIESTYTYRTQATIVALQDSSSTYKSHIPVILYLQKSYTASNLSGGDLIFFKPDLQRIEPPAIPHDYDYAQQMALKGFLYRQYLKDTQWKRASYTAPLTLREYATRVQSHCLTTLYDCGLSSENTSLLAALIWGARKDISETTRQEFAAAGMSHVLAVSGLHTGIIAFILWLLLYPLRYTRLHKIRHIITIILLWIYAFISGLSPSVTRACIMATFIGVAHIIDRRNTSLNALCGSATLILLVSPMQLFDIGFQLSYVAVAGIILLSPYFDLSRYTELSNPIFRYASATVAVSVAAQITTTPLAAYYFHYIPTWGLLSNIILVPLLPLIVIAALLLQLLHACHIPHLWFSNITDAMTDLLTLGANSISQLPFATIKEIWITPDVLIIHFILLTLLWYMLSRKTLRPIIPVLTFLIILQAIAIARNISPSTPHAFIAESRENTSLQLADSNHNCYIITTDTCYIAPRGGENWRIRENCKTHIVHPHDTIYNPDIYIALPFVQYYDKRLLWVDDNTWRYCSSNTTYEVDYAIITEKYKGKISHLLKNFEIDNIILSASIYPERSTSLQIECQQNNINHYDISQNRYLDIGKLH